LTVNIAGDEVLLDGVSLPRNQGRAPHIYSQLHDGSIIDAGFIGLLQAPGCYFSGLELVGSNAATHDRAGNGDGSLYFFVTGNWLNFQQVLNLKYTSGSGTVWKNESYPLSAGEWGTTTYVADYPAGTADYAPNLSKNNTIISITKPGADKIKVHFNAFDVDETTATTQKCWKKWYCLDVEEDPDYVVLYDEKNNVIAKYNNSNFPADGWSAEVPGDTARIALISNSNTAVGQGYKIDQYRALYHDASNAYTIESRLEIAQEALLDVIEEMRGKINWGFATFNYQGYDAVGATIRCALNPNENDDTQRAAINQQVKNVTPKYGTPLGEALQDVFDDGYFGHKSSLDNLKCRKNYVIVVSDGYASGDTEWDRIGGVTITDSDSDGFTADPSQSSSPNYYDDVASWMYTHSWLDKTAVTDPANSFENVISHQIGFGLDHLLMRNAADDQSPSAEYITAYNKDQLVSAFYSLALQISEAISFTAPVVSVDAANKVQNGDDLYMGQFLPMDATYWPGNLKKFKLGDGVGTRVNPWMIYDSAGNEAIDSSGLFLDNTDGFWGDENDANDADNHGTPDIQEDGVGEVLTERVASDFSSGNYYERVIKTYLDSSVTTMTEFDQSIDPTVFGLDATDTATRNKIVNWIYGYTFNADTTSGVPVGLREWALGAIVHSRPTVIDYYNTSDFSQISKRLIVAGADDGMMHVFDDGTGSVNGDGSGAELLAFVPPDLLTKLKNFQTELHQPMVDGDIKVYRQNGQPKYLIFGLRRGGFSFWALDIHDPNPANWTVAWSFSPSTDGEMGQSWSGVEIAKIRTDYKTFTDVAIFSGGYDPYEDNFPEPFNDLDNNGTPYASNGNIDSQEWKASDNSQDVYDDGVYTLQNPVGNSQGRVIYVVNLSDGSIVFSVKHGSTDSPSLGTASAITAQTRTDFKYCFPASPSVVSLSQAYSYLEDGDTHYGRVSNVLAAIYAPDIYGNLFRITYDYDAGKKWQVRKVFMANPDSASESGELRQGDSTTNQGRKVFYGPAVSWRGSGRYFDSTNYFFSDTTFSGTNAIATVFFGTGDREHPSYEMVQDRVYAVYDDTPVSAVRNSSAVDVETAPYTEDDLLNLTCDELGYDTTLLSNSPHTKIELDTLLSDDVVNKTVAGKMEEEPSGGRENDAKGWYIILEKQGLQGTGAYCEHCDYEATVDSSDGGRDDHKGEKVLSKLSLFNKTLYFTSYQPSYDDPCSPQGNAFTYALNYLDGRAAFNLNMANDSVGADGKVKENKDVTDRYGKHFGVKGLPSSFEIVTRNGEAGAMSSIGGSIKGIFPKGFQIPAPDSGIDLYYWIER
jgi:type IV pilus assembly protein PilY1